MKDHRETRKKSRPKPEGKGTFAEKESMSWTVVNGREKSSQHAHQSRQPCFTPHFILAEILKTRQICKEVRASSTLPQNPMRIMGSRKAPSDV